jgi:hypothetical protein
VRYQHNRAARRHRDPREHGDELPDLRAVNLVTGENVR